MTNAQTVYTDLVAAGLTPAAATGVVGNLVAESGVNPAAVQPGGPGRGIAQWSVGGRWNQLLAWAKANGQDPSTLRAQESFMVLEMKSDGVWNDLRGVTDVTQASNIVMRKYELPADQSAANGANRARLGVQAVAGAKAGGSSFGSNLPGVSTIAGAINGAGDITGNITGAVTGAIGDAFSGVADSILAGLKPLSFQLAGIGLAAGLVLAGAWRFTATNRAKAADTAAQVLPLAAL